MCEYIKVRCLNSFKRHTMIVYIFSDDFLQWMRRGLKWIIKQKPYIPKKVKTVWSAGKV